MWTKTSNLKKNDYLKHYALQTNTQLEDKLSRDRNETYNDVNL